MGPVRSLGPPDGRLGSPDEAYDINTKGLTKTSWAFPDRCSEMAGIERSPIIGNERV
jgi:hypothetical protein